MFQLGARRNTTQKKIHLPLRPQKGGANNMYAGINNEGNTCYYNSAIQMMYHIPEYKDYIMKTTEFKVGGKDDEFMKSIKTVFTTYDNADVDTKLDFKGHVSDQLKLLLNPSGGSDQHDASEFLALGIINKFPKEVDPYFKFKQRTTTICTIPGAPAKPEKVEDTLFLIPSINDTDKTMQDVLQSFEKEEILEKGNEVEGCSADGKTKGPAKKTISIESFDLENKYMLIILNRNKFTRSDSAAASTPSGDPALDAGLKASLATGSDGKINNPIDALLNIKIKGKDFKLQSFIFHAGAGGGGGHYFYYWKTEKPNEWCRFNDSTVTHGVLTNNADFIGHKNTGYVYLYQRGNNTDPILQPTAAATTMPPASPANSTGFSLPFDNIDRYTQVWKMCRTTIAGFSSLNPATVNGSAELPGKSSGDVAKMLVLLRYKKLLDKANANTDLKPADYLNQIESNCEYHARQCITLCLTHDEPPKDLTLDKMETLDKFIYNITKKEKEFSPYEITILVNHMMVALATSQVKLPDMQAQAILNDDTLPSHLRLLSRFLKMPGQTADVASVKIHYPQSLLLNYPSFYPFILYKTGEPPK